MNPLNIEQIKKRAQCYGKYNDKCARRKLKILQRDNFSCVSCGSKENLTIDHFKRPKSKMKRRNHLTWLKPDMCKILCVKCHTEKNIIMKSIKYKT